MSQCSNPNDVMLPCCPQARHHRHRLRELLGYHYDDHAHITFTSHTARQEWQQQEEGGGKR